MDRVAFTELPLRFNNRFTVSVPTSDWRGHPDTEIGNHYIYGNGIVHHDLINIPFHGYMYDTAVVAHPLSASDCFADPRIKVTHIQYVMCRLRDIQREARVLVKTTTTELRARQDSIEVLKQLRERAFDRLLDRYYARMEIEAPSSDSGDDSPTEGSFDFDSAHGQRMVRTRQDSVINHKEGE